MNSRDSLAALNEMTVVQASHPVQCVLCKRDVAALGRRKMSPAPTAAGSRNSFPALNADAVVQVEQFVKRVWSRRASVLPGPPAKVGNNSPRTPLIPPCGCAAAAGRGERDDCAREERRTGEGRPEGGKPWRSLSGLRAQCRCVLSDPPAVADSCPSSPDSRFKGKDYRSRS